MKLASFDIAAKILIDGGAGIVPTDTVYGLVACAGNKQATQRLYELKKRESKPGTIIAASIEQLISLGFSAEIIEPAKKYWPGPVSVVLAASDNLDYLHQNVGDIAVRVTNSHTMIELLNLTGPLISSSANSPGEPTAATIDEAHQYFGENVDFYVDGGDLSGRPASTIVKILPNGNIEVLRQGVAI